VSQPFLFPRQGRQCVGSTGTADLVDASHHPLAVRWHGNTSACTSLPSITASSISRSNGALNMGIHSFTGKYPRAGANSRPACNEHMPPV
jgi:hypothetical protein